VQSRELQDGNPGNGCHTSKFSTPAAWLGSHQLVMQHLLYSKVFQLRSYCQGKLVWPDAQLFWTTRGPMMYVIKIYFTKWHHKQVQAAKPRLE
jgi:hypothetical protein